ncbi:putative dual-specificity RNA methyltransferase RlmN [Spirochaetia bacterium]|nr:putative dual-specificity RNA methyltransferase RlmN [Spirochaetia bacterium]
MNYSIGSVYRIFNQEPSAFLALSVSQLKAQFPHVPSYRFEQIYQWIYKGAISFSAMANLPAALRTELANTYRIKSSIITATQAASDSSIKVQLALEDGGKIEAVLLEDGAGRKTACLSTQVGCAAGCVFCKTGTLGLKRNLRAHEMFEEYLHLKELRSNTIDNIVIMGMGEPLLNLDELCKVLSIFTNPFAGQVKAGAIPGAGLSRRRITVSTCGIASGINALADKGPMVRLALSLTCANQALRDVLMPLSKANPLMVLKESLTRYQEKSGERLTLEAVLLSGLNTSEEAACEMALFAKGLDVVVNLIPWNTVAGLTFRDMPLRSPSPAETRRFAHALEARGLSTTIRMEKGRTVSAACGQLGSV